MYLCQYILFKSNNIYSSHGNLSRIGEKDHMDYPGFITFSCTLNLKIIL